MKQNFNQYICSGTVGPLTLGMSRTSVLQKLGEPVRWLGKPPCIGSLILKYSKSPVWFYYANAVGVRFDELGLAVEFRVYPKNFFDQGLFANWPVKWGSRMSEIRTYLLNEQIPFYEHDEDVHFILAHKCCLIVCLYTRDNKPLPPDERPIDAIEVCANEKLLPNFIGTRRQREWSLLRSFFGSQFVNPVQFKSTADQLSAYLGTHDPGDLSALRTAIQNFLGRFEDDQQLREKLRSEIGCLYATEYLSIRGWLESLIFELENLNDQKDE